MKFDANLSMLFADVPFLDRFDRARACGFRGVEFLWPTGEDLDDVVAAATEADVEVLLFNFYAGDMQAGDRGLLSDPAREGAFRENVPVALELAGRLGTHRLNALVGLALPEHDREQQLALAARNVAWAARQARGLDVEIMVEAINTIHNGPYLLHTTAQAVEFIERVAEPNVRLQYDVFHMQLMEDEVIPTLRRHIERIAHVQVADAPERHEPGTGEIDYRSIFAALEQLGYNGWVGLEYAPAGGGASTERGLAWLAQHGYHLKETRA